MTYEHTIIRKTAETDIRLSLCLRGSGSSVCNTDCGFLNHMLTLFAKHGHFDLTVTCKGDSEVDFHHTTEDIAICLGKVFSECLGDKKGICRYGDIILPMDEALIVAAVDVSGRGDCYFALDIPAEKVGDFDTELCREFFDAFAKNAGLTLHLRQLCGINSHHIIEGAFKATARALAKAVAIDKDHAGEIPSTKGTI